MESFHQQPACPFKAHPKSEILRSLVKWLHFKVTGAAEGGCLYVLRGRESGAAGHGNEKLILISVVISVGWPLNWNGS